MTQLTNKLFAITLPIVLMLALAAGTTSCNSARVYDEVVTIHTRYGDMKVILFEETPIHKANFLELAREGRYDSTHFHRVIKNFMIQGGDLTQKPDPEEEPSPLDAEFVKQFFHAKGFLAAARQPDNVNPKKQSSGSQFYIVQGQQWTREQLTTDQQKLGLLLQQCYREGLYPEKMQVLDSLYKAKDFDNYQTAVAEMTPVLEAHYKTSVQVEVPLDRLTAYTTKGGAPHLDDEYTVFGKVVEGMEVIDQVATVPVTGPRNSTPVEKEYMTMEVERVKRKDITSKYGYVYPTEEAN